MIIMARASGWLAKVAEQMLASFTHPALQPCRLSAAKTSHTNVGGLLSEAKSSTDRRSGGMGRCPQAIEVISIFFSM